MDVENPEKQPTCWRRCGVQRLNDIFAAEFTWKCFGFTHARPSDFSESQWQWLKPWVFTIYRVLIALLMLVWVSFDIPRETQNYFGNKIYVWFVYATNWSFGLFVLVLFLLAVYVLVYNCPRRENERMILYQPLWLTYTLATNGIIVVSLVFWVALSNSDLGVFSSIWGRLKHSVPAVLAVVDLFISAIPVRLSHVIYPLKAGIIYILFSIIFWIAGIQGPVSVGQVYPGLNWSHPRAAILACLCVMFVSFLVHLFLYLTFFIRGQWSACVHGRGHVLEHSTEDAKSGYNQIADSLRPSDDLVSVASITTIVEGQSETGNGRMEYGTVE